MRITAVVCQDTNSVDTSKLLLIVFFIPLKTSLIGLLVPSTLRTLLKYPQHPLAWGSQWLTGMIWDVQIKLWKRVCHLKPDIVTAR